MGRTSNVFARIEPGVKEQAEMVLSKLGIPMSNAVDMFLRQVVIHRGIPFELKLAAERPLFAGDLSKEELNREIAKGLADIENGNVYSEEQVLEEMKRLYNL